VSGMALFIGWDYEELGRNGAIVAAIHWRLDGGC